MPKQTVTLEGRIEPQQEKTYLHLPFDMPEGATRLEVQYAYSHAISAEPHVTGGTTIDLGIFDSRGIDFLQAGFRGWSGSERSRFFITEDQATPGYLAGALIPGRWHVLLGLYKVAPQGSSYSVELTITTDSAHRSPIGLPAPVVGLPASPVHPRIEGWLRGELHCHSVHSDGAASPEELVQLAREAGLDFLAITDHNTTSSHHALANLTNPGVILLLGFEVTTFKGHFNVWGTGMWVDFRIQDETQLAAALHFANSFGAVSSCNHPKPVGPEWEFQVVSGFQCIEVWNGPWRVKNQASLDFWLSRLAAGQRIPAIGGSDYHRHTEMEQGQSRALGIPTSWVHISGPTTDTAILDAIRQGHVSLSNRPDGPLLELRGGSDLEAWQGDSLKASDEAIEIQVRCYRAMGDQLRIYDQRRLLWKQEVMREDESIHVRLPVAESLCVRAELRDEGDDMKALTNPIYLDR